jgi:hypothetical protein
MAAIDHAISTIIVSPREVAARIDGILYHQQSHAPE